MKREITSIQHPPTSHYSGGIMKGSKPVASKNGHCTRYLGMVTVQTCEVFKDLVIKFNEILESFYGTREKKFS